MAQLSTLGHITFMEQEFTQTGGVRYGRSFWFGWNFTAPFAHLSATKAALVLSVSAFGLWRRTFTFERAAIRNLRWKRGIFSLGLQIEHNISGYPPFILFWIGNRIKLVAALKEFGYDISDSNHVA